MMDKDFGFVPSDYRRGNSFGGLRILDTQSSLKRMNFKRCCGTEIQDWHLFLEVGEKFSDKNLILFAKYLSRNMIKRPKRIDFTADEIEALMMRIESQKLEAADFPLLTDLIRAMVWMENSLREKQLSIRRLQSIFGIKTESAKSLQKLLKPALSKVSSQKENSDNADEKDSGSLGENAAIPAEHIP
jgi:hypothetical protein